MLGSEPAARPGVLDAYSVPAANVAGVSAGEALVQRLTPGHPARVRSLVLSSTLPRPLVTVDYRIGRLNQFTADWMAYFRFAEPGTMFRDLDRWLRRRLRQVRWKGMEDHPR